MEITHINEKSKWLALNDEIQVGELHYLLEGQELVITAMEIEPYYRSNSVVGDLLLAAVDMAKVLQLKIKLQSEFALSVFERFPEYKDLLIVSK